MNVSVDLTIQKFEESTVNFYDSKTIFFDATTFLPSTVSFKVWGVGLMPDFDWERYIDLNKEINIRPIGIDCKHTIKINQALRRE